MPSYDLPACCVVAFFRLSIYKLVAWGDPHQTIGGISGCTVVQSKGGLPHQFGSSIAQNNLRAKCIFFRYWLNVKPKILA